MDTKNMIRELEEEKKSLDLKIIKIDSVIRDLERLDGEEPVNTKKSIEKVSRKKRKYNKSGDHKTNKEKKAVKYFAYEKEHIDFLKINGKGMNPNELAIAFNKKFSTDILSTAISSLCSRRGIKLMKSKMGPKRGSNKDQIRPKSGPSPGLHYTRSKGNRKQMFADEIQDIIKDKWESNSDRQLREMIGSKFKLWFTSQQINNFRKEKGWRMSKKGPRGPRRTDITNTPDAELNEEERKLKDDLAGDDNVDFTQGIGA